MPVVMPDPEDDDEPVELTAEQREDLREAFRNLQGAMLPMFKFNLPELAGLTKLQDTIAKSVAIPDSVMKNLSAITNISNAAAEAFKPFHDAQAVWAEQISVINSDALKSLRVMPEMESVVAQLVRNVDFDFNPALSRFVEQVAAQQQQWLKSVESLKTAFYPANLRPIDGLEFEEVEEVVMVDGIALYGLPRTEVAEARNPLSPHYADQTELFAAKRWLPGLLCR